MKLKFYLITIFLILLLSCSSDENIIQTEPPSQKKDVPSIDYSQLQSWRSELRTEILESRRRINLSNDLTLRSQIFVNETLDFYVWIKNNLSELNFKIFLR